MADPEVVKSALQMLAESEGREWKPAPTPEPVQQPALQPLDAYSAQFGQPAQVAPSTMSYPEQMRNVYETVRPTPQGTQDAAAIAASGIYGAPMDILGLVGGARELLKGRIPSHEEMSLPGGSQYLEQKAKEKGTLSQDPSLGATTAGILGSIFADPMAAAGKFGTLATMAIPGKIASTAEKTAPVVEKALAYSRELTPLGLYSHAAETAYGLKQTSTPEQALAWLMKQPNVRKEELFEAGIVDAKGKPTQDFLSMGKVTGPQLAEKIQKGAPDVQEVVLGGDANTYMVRLVNPGGVGNQEIATFPTYEEAYQFAHEKGRGLRGKSYYDVSEVFPEDYKPALYSPLSYPEASTAGGVNYREVLLQAPQKDFTPAEAYRIQMPRRQDLMGSEYYNTEEEARQAISNKLVELERLAAQGGPHQNYIEDLYEAVSNAKVNAVRDPSVRDPNYVMGHYRDYPNVLAHIRMQDFPDDRGGKILRVEEIQSDWAQGGRQKGWRVTPEEYQAMELEFEMAQVEKHKAYKHAMDEYEAAFMRNPNGLSTDEKYQAAYKEYEDAKNKYDKVKRAYDAYDPSRVHPKGPYVQETKDWTDLALKRILKEATSNPEYTKFQITAGDVQANRWAGSEDAEGVAKFYDTTVKSQLEKQLKKLDPDAKIVRRKVERENDETMERAYYEIEELESQIKSLEQELEFLEPRSDEYVDIEYRLGDLGAQLDIAKENYEKAIQPYHFYEVEITPKMREAIAKGLPRFKRGGKVNPHSESIVNKALVLSSKLG